MSIKFNKFTFCDLNNPNLDNPYNFMYFKNNSKFKMIMLKILNIKFTKYKFNGVYKFYGN